MRFRPGILLAALLGIATAWLASPVPEARPTGPAPDRVAAAEGSGAAAFWTNPVRGPARHGLALLAHVVELDPGGDSDDEVKGGADAGASRAAGRRGGPAAPAPHAPGRARPAHLATGPPSA